MPTTAAGRVAPGAGGGPDQGIPEDVRWQKAGVSFAALDIVGSNDSLAPWTGNTAPTPEQAAEVLARTSAVIQEIHGTRVPFTS